MLVACEFSGVVRDAFRDRGHNAWSCDLLPTERPGHHITGDATAVLRGGPGGLIWDLLIAHPPCTYLCNSGVRWLWNGDGSRNEGRWSAMHSAAVLFRAFMECQIPCIAIENPVMHGHARRLIGNRRPDCSVQPYEHGHGESKRTCFWLKNLPPLVPTNLVPGRIGKIHRMAPGPDRAKNRSRTYPGIAAAIADQWGAAAMRFLEQPTANRQP